MQTIVLNDALGIMEQREPFQLKFVTKTGGKIIELTNAVKIGSKYNQKENETATVKQLNNNNHPYTVHIHCIIEVNHQRIVI